MGGRAIEGGRWRLRKASGLIKVLALAPNHRLHREQVMVLLWPDLDAASAMNNLHHALHVARRVLDPSRNPSRFLTLRDEHLALCPDAPPWVDVEAFEEAARRARRVRGIEAYRAAIELYAGELLPEDRYESWLEGRRAVLRTLYLEMLAESAAILENNGDIGAAIDALRNVLVHESAHEEARAGLMRLYAASGHRYQALREYERLEETLRNELDARPKTSTRLLYEEILAGRVPLAPPADRSPPERTGRHNLPVSLTSFIGREREISDAELFLSRARLLTLSGAGGVGKTRLALEVARDLVGAYPDGAWFVELAPLSEPGLVPQAVAAALRAREQPGRSLTDTLAGALHTKELLLVLDNCEHLIDETARLADALLGSCEGLRVLATSREALGVAGEIEWVVKSLSTPGEEHPTDAESVRLFMDRARRRRPTFEPTEENMRSVGEICRRLDGVPLAVELAAARVGVLAPEQILARLDDALDLLTEGNRIETPRHRTLRATLAWSYDLLDERERLLFERLSVFAGGFSLAAAEAVGAEDGIGAREVLDLLSKLVHKSLVVVESDVETLHATSLRYGLLEPVRQYARERLEEGGGMEAVRRRHAEWCLGFARRAERGLSGPDQPAWIGRLETEQDNLRTALSWSLDGDEPESSLELAVAQQLFWHTQGLRSEGRRWLERAARQSGSVKTPTKAKALCVAGHMAAFQGNIEAARALAGDALSLSRELDDKESIAFALAVRGLVAVVGDEGSSIVLALEKEAMSLKLHIRDRRTLAFLLQFSGVVAVSRDDWGRAEALHEESLKLSREVRDVNNVSACLINFGLMAIEQADYERSLERLRENLRVTSEADQAGIMHTLAAMAVATAALGQTARAARLWGAAETMRETHGLRLVPMPRRRIRHDEWLADARSRLDEAAWEAAWAEGKAMTQEEVFEYALSEEETPPAAIERPPDSAARLTRREREVALLVARGLTNRRIAEELGISERTVENHVAKILRRLGFRSRARIAAWVAEQRLP